MAKKVEYVIESSADELFGIDTTNMIDTNNESNEVKPVEIDKKKVFFSFLKGLTNEKKKWDDYTEEEQKLFDVPMINKYLSMSIDYLEAVNAFQHLTQTVYKPKFVYNFYYHLLPKKYVFLEYIKGNKENRYDTELVEYISNYYFVNKQTAIYYLELLTDTFEGIEEVRNVLMSYGVDEKRINKMTKFN